MRILQSLVAMVLTALSAAALACSSCGCTLGSDWSDAGLTTASGLKLDVRMDLVDQNQLRNGRTPSALTPSSAPEDLDEIQQQTLTHFYLFSADYEFDPNWGLNVQLPYLSRQHATIPLPDAGVGDDKDRSSASGIGDLRLLARYQGFLSSRHFGLQFGLKLPTGRVHQGFDSGPDAGAEVDRGLQLGTGTIDATIGAYDHGLLEEHWDHFEQLQYKVALDSYQQFRPSPQLSLNLGLRYQGSQRVMPQLQLNLRWEGREIGKRGDYDNSGSRVVYLSPGVTVRLSEDWHAYAFSQWPIYQDYTGFQLAPRYTASVGMGYHF